MSALFHLLTLTFVNYFILVVPQAKVASVSSQDHLQSLLKIKFVESKGDAYTYEFTYGKTTDEYIFDIMVYDEKDLTMCQMGSVSNVDGGKVVDNVVGCNCPNNGVIKSQYVSEITGKKIIFKNNYLVVGKNLTVYASKVVTESKQPEKEFIKATSVCHFSKTNKSDTTVAANTTRVTTESTSTSKKTDATISMNKTKTENTSTTESTSTTGNSSTTENTTTTTTTPTTTTTSTTTPKTTTTTRVTPTTTTTTTAKPVRVEQRSLSSQSGNSKNSSQNDSSTSSSTSESKSCCYSEGFDIQVPIAPKNSSASGSAGSTAKKSTTLKEFNEKLKIKSWEKVCVLSESSSSSCGPGCIAGIVITVIILVVVAIGLTLLILKKRS